MVEDEVVRFGTGDEVTVHAESGRPLPEFGVTQYEVGDDGDIEPTTPVEPGSAEAVAITLEATPSWVIVEDLGVPERRSEGGIVMPGAASSVAPLKALRQGTVLSAGAYASNKFSGGEIQYESGWLEPGSLVYYVDHNVYEARGEGFPVNAVAIRSEDIVVAPEESLQKVKKFVRETFVRHAGRRKP